MCVLWCVSWALPDGDVALGAELYKAFRAHIKRVQTEEAARRTQMQEQKSAKYNVASRWIFQQIRSFGLLTPCLAPLCSLLLNSREVQRAGGASGKRRRMRERGEGE